jgi:hypothetical protein
MTMNATPDVSPLEATILLRLLTSSEKDSTRSSLQKSLKPFLEHRWSEAEQRSVVDEALGSLEGKEHLALEKKSRFVVTDAGKRAGLLTLGLASLPRGGWRIVKKHMLAPALAGSTPAVKSPSKTALNADRLGGRILANHYDLQAGENPTRLQSVDALVRKALGMAPGKRLTVNAIRAWILDQKLGAADAKERKDTTEKDIERIATQLAARTVKARRVTAPEIELAVFRQWFDGDPTPTPAPESTTAEPSNPAPPAKPEPIGDDRDFARRVLTAARATKTGRFGEDKVFISHVFRKLVSEGAVADDDRSFKDRLISAHRDDHLTLSRADLVGAMDPGDVDSSEASYRGATFHFIHV